MRNGGISWFDADDPHLLGFFVQQKRQQVAPQSVNHLHQRQHCEKRKTKHKNDLQLV